MIAYQSQETQEIKEMNWTTTVPPNGITPQVMFSWVDYALFVVMLGLSTLIGVYYGFCGSKQDTTKEYLLGGKTMRVFPIAISLIASHTSGIALLSVPADIYKYGATYLWVFASIIINSLVCVFVFMPVFLKLQVSSTYEYLKLRFDNKIRILASFLYTLSVLLYNPIVIYVPALALSQATGINLHFITPIVCIICIFYTTIGGLRAVVWTDTLQGLAIGASMSGVLIMGIISAGGISNIWTKSVEGHRLDILDFNIDPTRRDSIWAFIIGGSSLWISNFCINQATVQRFMAVPSLLHAKKVVLVFCIGTVFVKTVSSFTGLVMFTKYSDCDPLSTKQVLRNDQILPYYVMDVAASIPGLPGLFIAGVFSAALSTLSTTLNTLAGTIYEDFLSPFMPPDITQKRTSNILKLIVVIVGAISTVLVFVVEHLGGVFALGVSVGGITGGPLLGLFCLGMFCPSANSKGALVGGVLGLIFSSWMVIGNQLSKRIGLLEDFAKPVYTDGCNFFVNTSSTITPAPSEPAFFLYRITFYYYTFMGTIVVVVIGLVVSLFTNKDESPVHPDLISPVARFLISKENQAVSPFQRSDYLHVDNALRLVTLNSEKDNEEKD